MKIGPVAVLLAMLAVPADAQRRYNLQTVEHTLMGELDEKPGTELVHYKGCSDRPDISGHFSAGVKPGQLWNTVTVYQILDKPETPYTEFAIKGNTVYARRIHGFTWQGPKIERMRIGTLEEMHDGRPEEKPALLMAEPGWKIVYFVKYNESLGYRFGVIEKSNNDNYEGGVLKSQLPRIWQTVQK